MPPVNTQADFSREARLVSGKILAPVRVELRFEVLHQGKIRMPEVMKTLFLNPPSYEGFDGGAGARYQARREIKSFWYPTWLAQPAAMVPGSRLIDAPPDGLTVDQVAPLAKDYELVVLHTSTPSFTNDAKFAAHLKEVNPKIMVGMVGAHVGVLPLQSMNAAPAVDWVAVGELIISARTLPRGSR